MTAPAVELAERWLVDAAEHESLSLRRRERHLARLLDDPDGLRFSMAFIDRVLRAPTNRSAAAQFRHLVRRQGAPPFLNRLDRALLHVGARVAPLAPMIVMPLSERRMRRFTDHLVVPAAAGRLARHLRRRHDDGVRLNLNRLGEAILGDEEAERRVQSVLELLARPDVSYVSVKVSAVASQLNLWSFDHSVARVAEQLRRLYRAAQATDPPGFVNLDMEEYRDLDLTIAVFTTVLDEPEFRNLDAGIVLQAYLPDSFGRMVALVDWANARRARGGGSIKIRIVKGANLAMERVEAEMQGWPQAPYASKDEVDANWKGMIDWAGTPERLAGVRLGIASHNLFDVAWAHTFALERGVSERLEFEMLEGMAAAQAGEVQSTTGSMLLYTPIVERDEYQSAIAYLFRRLEENAAPHNFLRHVFEMQPGSPPYAEQRDRFERSLAACRQVSVQPRRVQDRSRERPRFDPDEPFANEPDTDPALAANRTWMAAAVAGWRATPDLPVVTDVHRVDELVRQCRHASEAWRSRPAGDRRAALERVGEVMAARRGEIIAAMAHEAGKVVAEGDPEVSEAIDFARWYARGATAVHDVDGAAFSPLGVVVVTPPWNFPFAIPAGGVLAALAAGNGVILKPAPETPTCARLVAECCHEAGLAVDLVRYLRVPDDGVGRHLVTHEGVGAVILTGAWETAQRFRSWKPELRLFAETSGKNSLIVTARADIDAAVADLVRSAFGHGGQKCSAASLAIVEAGLYDSPAFRRQLRDAVSSLTVGEASDLATDVGPLIRAPGEDLERAFSVLEPGEEWLVVPAVLDAERRMWAPGVKLGVRPGSWFHHTECFGPVLGVMRANDLDQAIEWQNAVPYGLTGGIWTLDPDQIDRWTERVEVGNAYVNRHTTGAIVNRQPFGGWKRSVIGPGAKAGGPNYVAQLGHWADDGLPGLGVEPGEDVRWLLDHMVDLLDPDDATWLRAAARSDAAWWRREFSVEHDPSGLVAEANVFRYRSLPRMVARFESDAPHPAVARVVIAASVCGVAPTYSAAASPQAELVEAAGLDVAVETHLELADRIPHLAPVRLRAVGTVTAELRSAVHAVGASVIDDPPVACGRIELMRYLREQAISRTMHRYGNIIERPA